MNIDQWRREYLRGGLNRDDLLNDPLEQFKQWLAETVKSKLSDPSAMCLATVDGEGRPTQRIVLLKGFDQRGFVFYTNLGSKKAVDIAGNPQVSLHFPWHTLERQIIVCGTAELLNNVEVEGYFRSRPRDSQLAAWASHQSQSVKSRQTLDAQFEQYKARFADKPVPRPEFWGGYRVRAQSLEFWQGGGSRLHDRFRYCRKGDSWEIKRLYP
ncbi:MAG: pyridoxamine 5'-phosphate oxidase [Gammaproteobacteria bacterium]|nr:pyridoxamine 5'-phosphate oxidase [Gammaproteobacteria bacterium]